VVPHLHHLPAPSMVAALARVSFFLQRAEEDVLRTAGFKVKNTFIDEALPLQPSQSQQQQQPAHIQRSVTTPLPRHQTDDWFGCASSSSEEDVTESTEESDEEAMVPLPSWPQTMSAMNSERACFDLDLEEDATESTASSTSVDDQYEVLGDSDSEAMVHIPSWPRTMSVMSSGDLEPMSGEISRAQVALDSSSWDTVDVTPSNHGEEHPASPAIVGEHKSAAKPVLLLLERRLSDASTATPSHSITSPTEQLSFGRSNSLTTVGSQPSSIDGEESNLALLLRRECAFLKITGSSLMPLAPRSSGTKRVPLRSVSQCLRICIIGLPGLKRHKWQQPLAWAVAGVLERAGCPAFVRRGELFASLDTHEGGELVRVDLCAPRESDDE